VKSTIIGAILHAVSVIGLIVAAAVLDADRLAMVVPMLAALTGIGGTMTAAGPPLRKKKPEGFARLGLVFGLAIVSSLFIGCVHTFKCKEGTVKLTQRPDGSAVLTAPCDADPEAVRIEWGKFGGIKVKGVSP